MSINCYLLSGNSTKDTLDGLKAEARNKTVNEIYETWLALKRGVKDNTLQNYRYMYEGFVKENVGQLRISKVKKSDIKRFYNYLADERGLKIATIDGIHTVLHQVLQIAVLGTAMMRSSIRVRIRKYCFQNSAAIPSDIHLQPECVRQVLM